MKNPFKELVDGFREGYEEREKFFQKNGYDKMSFFEKLKFGWQHGLGQKNICEEKHRDMMPAKVDALYNDYPTSNSWHTRIGECRNAEHDATQKTR